MLVVTSNLEPSLIAFLIPSGIDTKYTKRQIQEKYNSDEELEFLKPDGIKSVGPILKLGGKTYNVKDKYTGKSFTYKYSGKDVKLEET